MKQMGPGIPSPSMQMNTISLPDIVDIDVWKAAHAALLLEEKALTKARDAIAAKRRRMPMTPVRPDYRFVGPEGDVDLLGMFQGRRQLIVYRFFYAPDVVNWPDGACPGCSWLADSMTHHAHLAARDTTLVFVTAAPQDRVATYKRRMGWDIPFYTLIGDEFSNDFDVSEMFGFNVFIREGDKVFRTYFVNGRGAETIGPMFSLLDLTPLGRQEEWEDSPPGRPQGKPYEWWRLHDSYGDIAAPDLARDA